MNAWMRTGLSLWRRPVKRLPDKTWTTTRPDRTAAVGACHLQRSRRTESPVNWRFSATQQDGSENQLISQTLDFWNLDWCGDWGQVMPEITCAGLLTQHPAISIYCTDIARSQTSVELTLLFTTKRPDAKHPDLVQ